MDLSLGNQHYHAALIRKLRSWMNGFFKIVGFAGKRFLLSFPLPLHALFCARPNFPAAKKSEKCIERAESLTETLATQAKETT